MKRILCNKRVLCALWMAGFANLAAFPLWIIWMSSGFRGDNPLPISLQLAFVGALVGGLLQPVAVGRHSNVLFATLMGAICALLAIPLLMTVLVLFVDTPSFSSIRAISELAVKLIQATPRAIENSWFIVLPVGAIGGLLLQIVWRHHEDKTAGASGGFRRDR